jgi:hypothetical protein
MKNQTAFFLILFLLCVTLYALWPENDFSSDDNPVLNQLRENLGKIHPDYKKIPLRENDSGAYTQNKRVIYLCLKDPKTGKYYDMNTLTYIILHECAHVLNPSYEPEFDGHGEGFKRIFSSLLRHASHVGIYDPSKPLPTKYCE